MLSDSKILILAQKASKEEQSSNPFHESSQSFPIAALICHESSNSARASASHHHITIVQGNWITLIEQHKSIYGMSTVRAFGQGFGGRASQTFLLSTKPP
jgi:hypothetical protein